VGKEMNHQDTKGTERDSVFRFLGVLGVLGVLVVLKPDPGCTASQFGIRAGACETERLAWCGVSEEEKGTRNAE
jgi:hypothetical protein